MPRYHATHCYPHQCAQWPDLGPYFLTGIMAAATAGMIAQGLRRLLPAPLRPSDGIVGVVTLALTPLMIHPWWRVFGPG